MAEANPISPEQLAWRRGNYGFDAPYVPIAFIAIGIVLLGLTATSLWVFQQPILAEAISTRRAWASSTSGLGC